MKAVALTASRPARWPLWLVAAPVVVLVVLGGGWLLVRNLLASSGASIDGGVYYTVRPMDLDVTIEKAGELQSANNIEIVSRVEGQTTIQSLVKEGTWVKQGDILCVLDSANIRQRIDEVSLDVQRAEADLANSRELAAIQELQNAANIELAESELRLAKIALEQYTEGTYPQQKKDAETDLKWAKIQLTNKQEDLAQTISLYEKGFVTAADVKKAELEVTTAQNAVSKAENTLHVLVNYSNKMDLASKQTAVVQAEQRLVRVKREASSAMAQRTADLKAREQAYNLQVRKLKQLQEQLEACTVRAPEDGLVVYASSGERNAQVQIQEGAQIRERQPIFRLPDTSEMKVTIRVSESQVTKLRVGQRASVNIVGVPEAVNATVEKISVMADSSQRFWNPDLKEYPVELKLSRTPPNLKPGMTAPATIYIERLRNVLAVPLGSIYVAGRDRYVFVRGEKGATPVKVKLGATNESHAQVLEGVKAGNEVLILESEQGRKLLERAGIKVEESNGRRRDDNDVAPPPDAPSAQTTDAQPQPAPGADADRPRPMGEGGDQPRGERRRRFGGSGGGGNSSGEGRPMRAPPSDVQPQ